MPQYLDDGLIDYSSDSPYDGSDTSGPTPQELQDLQADPSDAHLFRTNDPALLDSAIDSGVSPSLVDQLRSVWSSAGNAVGSVSSWAHANPGFASLLTSGISNAQKQKYSNEQLAKMREWQLADVADKRAYDKSLWDRRNQSVIGTNTADLGIIGNSMIDPQVAYLQGRKT
jgi:hypothetical protein